MLKAFIFDIGNVLLHFSHERMLLQISEELKLPFSNIEQKFRQEGLISSYESGALSTDQFLQILNEISTSQATRESLLYAMSSIFVENSSIFPIIHALKRQGKKLLLLSNTNEAHFDFIQRHFTWVKLFDAAILSYEVKGSKPEPAIYQAALKAADCYPHECFYVDDVPSHVEAARKLGLDAELYVNTQTLRTQLAKRMVFV
jgi:HAD superfamily hydrolase (TIGR01509 family)